MTRNDFQRWLDGDVEPLDEQITRTLTQSDRATEDPFEKAHPREEMTYERFHRWSHTKGEKLLNGAYTVMAVLLCLGLIALLVFSSLDLPGFGGEGYMVDNEVSVFYVEDGVEHTGAANIVTGIILDFRGFDTLGESHVLFIAACTVLLLLHLPAEEGPMAERERLESEANDRLLEPKQDSILINATGWVFPLILVFGINILLNGHLTPGGGFSGGSILGAGLILYLSTFGFARAERFFTFKTFRIVTTCALLFYACSKGYVFFTGANGLENGLGTGTFGSLFSGGLLMPLSLCVGMVVACTMYALYTLFRKGDM